MNRTVLVPIDVEALLVEEPFTPPRHDGAPFTAAGEVLDEGVHLSWALPDGLTRGERQSDGSLQFPTIPDRWLIVRFGPGTAADGRRELGAFLVDAWNRTSRPLPSSAVVSPVPDERSRLTVAGLLPNGILDASAADGWHLGGGYYAASKNRFGFHDRPDLSRGPVSYVVIGWYGSESEDPLLGSDTTPLLTLGLRLDAAARSDFRPAIVTPEPPVQPPRVNLAIPRSVLAKEAAILHTEEAEPWRAELDHASAAFARLQARDERYVAELPQRVQAEADLEASAQALERAFEQGSRRAGQVEKALGGLPSLSTPFVYASPPSEVGLVCHGAIFDVGRETFGERAYRRHRKATGAKDSSPASLHANLGDALDAALDGAVAESSRQFLRALLAGQGSQLLDGASPRAAADAVFDAAFLGEPSPGSTAYLAVVRDVGDPKAKATLPDPPAGTGLFVRDLRTRAGKPLPTGLDAKDLPTLRTQAGATATVAVESFIDPPPRWYRPAAPTLLVESAGRTYRFGFDERFSVDGYLGAREPAAIVAAQTISVLGGVTGTVTGIQLVDTGLLPAFLPAPVVALVEEAAVLDPLSQPFADAAVGVPSGTPEADVARSFGAATLPTSFAVKRWRQPFVPLFAEVAYRVTLKDGSVLTGSERALLGPASETLGAGLESTAKMLGSAPEVAGLLSAAAAVKKLDLLTAALPGVGALLLSQGQSIREGTLAVTDVRLVDVFGQTRSELPAAGKDTVSLPRAFTPPARLACRFVDAGVGLDVVAADAGPTVSPVVGFLRTDPIEQAIELFDHEGRSLGQLRHDRGPAGGSPARVLAEGPVGSDETLAQALGEARPCLRELVAAMRDFPMGPTDQDTSVSALTRIVDTTRFLVDGATSSSYRESLLGRAIVLLRVHLDLERGQEGPTGTVKVAPGAVKLRAGVALGCLSRMDDGLLGYWVGTRSGGKTTWSGFRTVEPPLTREEEWPQTWWGGDQREAVTLMRDIRSGYIEVMKSGNRLEVVEGEGVELVVALDGRLGFTVQCDELPTKHLRPLEAFGGATLKKLAPSFPVGPVLIDPSAFTLPAPALEAERTTWVRQSAPGTRELPIEGYAEQRTALPNKRMRVEDAGAIRFDPGLPTEPEG